MEFKEIQESINTYLKQPKMLSNSEVDIVKGCFKLLSDDINELINNVHLEQNTNKFNVVLNALLMISHKVLEGQIDNDFLEFSTAFTELIYNWNANVQQDEVLRQLSLYVSRTFDIRKNVIETTRVLKDLDERMRDLSSWSPPSYEIATEYFEALLEENEKEKV
jgi:hypothetical protein